jgi:PAS domain S-box-containing protein
MGDLDAVGAQRLVRAVAIPLLALDAEGRVQWLNPAAERLLAWRSQDLSGKPIEAVLPAREHAVQGMSFYAFLVDHATRALERPVRFSALRKDGVEIEIECNVAALAPLDGAALVLSLQRRPESQLGIDVIDGESAAQPQPPVEVEQELERYREVFDHAPLGILHFDARGVITGCNEQFVRVIGSSKQVLIGLNMMTLLDAGLVASLRGALAGRRSHYEGDYRSATGGKLTPVRVDFAPIFGADGAVAGGVGIVEDITERKRDQDALRRSNAALRAVFEASPLAIVSLDVDGHVRMWNPAAERMFGLTEEAALARPLSIVPPERWDAYRAHLAAILTGETRVGLETQSRRPDGGSLEVSISAAPLRGVSGDMIGVMAVLADITERKRSQAERAQLLQQEHEARMAAEEARRRLQFLAEASAVLAGSLDYHDTVQRAARMAMPHFAQLCIIDLLDKDGVVRRERVVHKAIDSERARVLVGEPTPSVMEVAHGGHPLVGRRRQLAWPGIDELGVQSAVTVPLEALGRTLGALTLASDKPGFYYSATDLHLALELGRRAGVAIDNARLFHQTELALQARDEFLSVASHELRTPLTSLRLSAENLEQIAAEGSLAKVPIATVTRALGTIMRQSRHLSRLIHELLDVSRIQAGRLELALEESVDLAQVARAAAARLEQELSAARCPVIIDAPESVLGTWDRGRLDQVVTNLLTNAVKFGAGKPIAITVDCTAELARLEVTDQGIGIPVERQAQIFDRFERGVSARYYGGLGLGLYIARQIIDAHRGSISVASEPGKGAAFTVTLPRSSSSPQP